MITPDLISRSNRKTLSLSILKDGQIVIKAPLKMSDDAIEKFVFEKQHWIRQKLAYIEHNKEKFDEVMNLKKFLLFGNEYTLKLANIKKIETSNNEMSIYVPNNIPEDKVFQKLKNWYKKIAKNILEERLNYICGIIKLKPNNFRISDSKGRWGACNSRGSISFNFRVVMLPPAVIDYVIVHELCHLIEMNHSKKFWDLVNSFLPNTNSLKQKIKEYSFLLSLYNKS